MKTTYSIVANRTPADVLNDNDITLETNLSLEEARIASLEYQRQGRHVAVWIEEEAPKPAPRIVRTVERNYNGPRLTVYRVDGWLV